MSYRLVRALFRLSMRGFFRAVSLEGAQSIPRKGPVLFVSNHTNAFVDPLVLLTSIHRRITLTAKATLTRNPLLSLVIRAMGVILFHRVEDLGTGRGLETGKRQSRNSDALAQCVRVLRGGGAVFVFPEGISHSDPEMRPFRNGAARIVIDYLKDAGAPALTVVPVGLHYSAKDRWRSDAVALVGAPTDARMLAHQGDDPAMLTAVLRQRVEALTANFSSSEERDLITEAGWVLQYLPEGPLPLDREVGFDAAADVERVHRLQRGAHRLHEADPALFASLTAETRSLVSELRSLGVEPREVSLSMRLARAALFVTRELEILLVGAPLAMVGGFVHLAPYLLTRHLVRALSQDEDHPASNAVFLSIPIFVAWWTGLAGLAFVVGTGWLPFVLLGAPFTGLVHLQYRDRAGGALRRLRTFVLWWRRPDLRRTLEERLTAWQAHLLAAEATLPEPQIPALTDG